MRGHLDAFDAAELVLPTVLLDCREACGWVLALAPG